MLNSITKLIIGLLALLALSCPAQAITERVPLPVEQVFQLSASSQDAQTLVLQWQIAPGYYLYADRFHFQLTAPKKASFGQPILAPSITKYDPAVGHYHVYQNQATVALPIVGKHPLTNISAHVTYQGCSAKGYCYPPITKQVALNLSMPQTAATITAVTAETSQNKVMQLLQSQKLLVIVLAFIGFGLLLSFTPCVLPMIPILSSIILGQRQHLSTGKAFRLSLVYVLSMSLTYAIAGVLVGYLGGTLQANLQKPWVIVFFSLVFIALALALFGFYNLQLPSRFEALLARITGHQAKASYLGVGIMGCLGTLIVSPCVTPPLVGVLGYIGQTGNAFLGGVALFFTGIGMGIPLLLICTSGVKWLPKTGYWMVGVKNLLGVLMLGVAIWMLGRVLPGPVTLLLWAALFIFCGLYLGALSFGPKDHWGKIGQGLGILLLVYGVILIIAAAMGHSNPFKPLRDDYRQSVETIKMQTVKSMAEMSAALAAAKAEQRPVIVDFYADWCMACKLFDRNVLTNAEVRTALQRFALIRVDITANDANAKALSQHYNVIAPPTFLFFSASGLELDALRAVGELTVTEFLDQLAKVN